DSRADSDCLELASIFASSFLAHSNSGDSNSKVSGSSPSSIIICWSRSCRTACSPLLSAPRSSSSLLKSTTFSSLNLTILTVYSLNCPYHVAQSIN
ncbi:unnamed protein product, partial [Callosobruchus maculatus]